MQSQSKLGKNVEREEGTDGVWAVFGILSSCLFAAVTLAEEYYCHRLTIIPVNHYAKIKN